MVQRVIISKSVPPPHISHIYHALFLPVHLSDPPIAIPSHSQIHSSDTPNRTLDPIFAITIGLAAAANRIHREETEKGRDMSQTLEVLRRRVGIAWESVRGSEAQS
ncbi:hypothetical protein M011DRAFT_404025 [Sporormia fimetaria CBS 119925]|uniref:Uncharacterized protein n=1 Tax=Sporormia fimetaria CBS 119925 TaxID=1340428 RepID=A0A6A6VAK4_9PLEO|nr:hypothetical protein M011DRAFT_404025 [Sporormia fimetaria CBS 119925]